MDLAKESTVRQLIQEDERSKWVLHSNRDVKCFTEDEVKGITNNYQTVLGRGAFGEVYQGVLEDTSMVAVKRFIHNVKQDFAKELTVHREINHKNVVKLIGYCVDENALMMITEYISKGNLSDALHRDNIPIPLDTRLGIAIECADALHYMHSQMYTRVIHGDIKPANILLGEMLRAKLSDFGISRLVNTDHTLYTLNVIGSIGYMDPLFALNGRLTEKSDVYSFGVVLLELITRKRARTDGEEMSFVECFTQALAKGIKRVREMFDPEIATPSDMKTIEEIAKLVGRCLSMEPCKRPAMLEVAERLRRLREALGQGKLAMFSWGKRRNKPVVAETPLQESSSRDNESVGLLVVGPDNAEESQEQDTNKTEVIVFLDSTVPTGFQLEAKYLREASTQVLRRGIAWTTCKAKLLSGVELVYKSLKGVRLQEEEFVQRVTAIGAIKNEHVAPLRGYYYSDDWKVLVYDHMPMGSLEKMLHGVSPESLCRNPDLVGLLQGDTEGPTSSVPAPLDWKQRSAISLAVARGVAFIHSAGPSSVHGNIKSSNILLTGTHNAVLSEHGLMTLVGPLGNSKPKGNRAPEHSQEGDVYRFGLLLLELLTGRPKEKPWQSSVLNVVHQMVCDGGLAMVLAKKVVGWGHTRVEEKGIVQLLQVAMDCCERSPPPKMSEVVQAIEMIPQQS